MHRDLLAVVLAFALAITSGLANPLTSQALQGDAVSGRIAPVEWTGEVVPGQGNVTLTADSLHVRFSPSTLEWRQNLTSPCV